MQALRKILRELKRTNSGGVVDYARIEAYDNHIAFLYSNRPAFVMHNLYVKIIFDNAFLQGRIGETKTR